MWGTISCGEPSHVRNYFMWGIISCGELFHVWNHILWGTISCVEPYPVGNQPSHVGEQSHAADIGNMLMLWWYKNYRLFHHHHHKRSTSVTSNIHGMSGIRASTGRTPSNLRYYFQASQVSWNSGKRNCISCCCFVILRNT